jgi:GNAT superfamily N-acetyltransferase
MNLRRATSDDVTAIRELVSKAYGKYVERIGRKPKPMAANYAAAVDEHQVWVSEFEEEVGAVIELVPCTDYLLIENIAVDPKRQGAGVGRALLGFAELEARRQGFSNVRLYTNAQFTENLIIYSKIGYRETHRDRIGATEAVHMVKEIR